jgi:hypothetical protein
VLDYRRVRGCCAPAHLLLVVFLVPLLRYQVIQTLVESGLSRHGWKGLGACRSRGLSSERWRQPGAAKRSSAGERKVLGCGAWVSAVLNPHRVSCGKTFAAWVLRGTWHGSQTQDPTEALVQPPKVSQPANARDGGRPVARTPNQSPAACRNGFAAHLRVELKNWSVGRGRATLLCTRARRSSAGLKERRQEGSPAAARKSDSR